MNLFRGGAGKSAASYVNTPACERPEVDNITMQQVGPAPWKIRTYADQELPWAAQIDSARFGQALCGSWKLALRYVAEGSAFGLQGPCDLTDAMDAGPVPQTGETFPCILEGQLVENAGAIVDVKSTTEAKFTTPPEIAHLPHESVGAPSAASSA